MDNKMSQIFEDSLDNWPMAHDDLKAAYGNLREDLGNYITEVQKQAFLWGYEVGRKAGE